MNDALATEMYIPLLGGPFEVHWNFHGMLMVFIWFFLVPIGVLAIRYFKPKPTTYGIPKGTEKLDRRLLWWTIHNFSLYSAIGLSVVGGIIATIAVGGINWSVHSVLGFGTLIFGVLQIISAWFRGTHGGKQGTDSDPEDRTTWGGDHFDMTPVRRRFEAYHKSSGYFALLFAFGAVVTGLMTYWVTPIAVYLVVLFIGLIVLVILLEYKGLRYDTYKSVYGNHPDQPYNKKRKDI